VGFHCRGQRGCADDVFYKIEKAAEVLTQFPKLGRQGKMRGTRELSVAGTPYRIVYEVTKSTIEVRRVIHGARDWPPRRKRRP
jgi:toxin ParE1/3/4